MGGFICTTRQVQKLFKQPQGLAVVWLCLVISETFLQYIAKILNHLQPSYSSISLDTLERKAFAYILQVTMIGEAYRQNVGSSNVSYIYKYITGDNLTPGPSNVRAFLLCFPTNLDHFPLLASSAAEELQSTVMNHPYWKNMLGREDEDAKTPLRKYFQSKSHKGLSYQKIPIKPNILVKNLISWFYTNRNRNSMIKVPFNTTNRIGLNIRFSCFLFSNSLFKAFLTS